MKFDLSQDWLEVRNLNMSAPVRYHRVHAVESYSASDMHGMMLFLLGMPETVEAQRIIGRHCRAMEAELLTLKRELDPKHQAQAMQWLLDAERIFKAADLAPIFIKKIPNEYDAAYFPLMSWLLVTTPVGTFKIGSRKRVLHLEWTDTVVVETAEELFPDEDVTKLGRVIHAWSDAKATQYIRRIAEAAR